MHSTSLLILVLAACGGGSSLGSDGGGEDGVIDASIDAPVDAAVDASILDAGPSSSRHTARPLGTTMAAVGFWEYLPADYGDGGIKSPLLIFNHGIGENDNDPNMPPEIEINKVPATGIPALIKNNQWPSSRPFVVLSPQHPGGGCPGPAEIRAFLDYALAHYDIDPTRVYLTGLSCGAIGSWDYMGMFADDSKLAAFVPIAGNGNPAWNSQGCDLAKTPIWAFHGDADGTVGVSGTTSVMANLAGCASPPALETKVTIYPGVDHDSWSRTYSLSAGHDIYAWMLSKARP